VTLTLSITEQLIAAEPKVSRALTGSNEKPFYARCFHGGN
jgi:hypothetical protein